MKLFFEIWLLAILLLEGRQVQAQVGSANEPTPLAIAPESTAFEDVVKDWTIRPFFELPTYSFYVGPPDVKGYAYVPNYATRLGLTLGWHQTQLTVTSSLPIPKEEIDRRGNSVQQSFNFHTHWRSYALDFYSQYYRGLYAGSPLNELSAKKQERFTQFPDASVRNFGINVYYLFDDSRFSLKAAFNQSEIATVDGGSWYVMPFLNRLELDMGNEIIVGSGTDAVQSKPPIHHIDLTSLGSTLGYGYTWVFPLHHLFLSAQSSLGPALQSQTIENPDVPTEKTYGIAGKFNLKISFAHNVQEEIWGVRFFADTLYSQVGSLDLYSSVMTGQVFYGFRF